jgi:hypothetical protein
VIELIAKVLLPTVAFVCIAIGVPLLAVNAIRMTRHKATGNQSWHDMWGLNKFNLLFFPSLLTVEGRRLRSLAIRGAKITLIAVLSMVLASAITSTSSW